MIRRSIIPALLIAVGVIVFAIGSRYPQFHDPSWEQPFLQSPWHDQMERAFDKSTHGDDEDYNTLAAEWEAARANALTIRDSFHDFGIGLISLGVGLNSILARIKPKKLSDLRSIRTPSTPGRFLAAMTATWLAFIPAVWAYYFYTSARDDYPYFGDVIAIPCFGVLLYDLITLPIVLIFLSSVIRYAVLPVPVFSRPILGRHYMWCTILWMAIIVILITTLVDLIEDPFAVAPGVVLLYLILSARAAVVNSPPRLPSLDHSGPQSAGSAV
ncbi:MAG TPA: hypothetical protein VG722_01980 [Tepidisphaeraceae bacterium]|nr:hypothetical protein [Tepidisphaeraceae bacterium]